MFDAIDVSLAYDEARSTRSYDPFGRLSLALTPISKAQVSPYKGAEIPQWRALGLDPDRIYMLLRPPDELQKAAASFNKVPILSKHQPVSADKHRRDLTIGTTGDRAIYRHPFLYNTLSLWDGDDDAIGGIEDNTKRALSCGYAYTPDMTPGVWQGQRYDGVMRDIKGNHLITTKVGRAGPDVVVGDSLPETMRAAFRPHSYASPTSPIHAPPGLTMPAAPNAVSPTAKDIHMATQLSPIALKARRAAVTLLTPVMALDQAADITPAFIGLKQLDERSRYIVTNNVCRILAGKIKPTMALDDVSAGLRALLEALGGGEPTGAAPARQGLPA